MFVSDAGDLWQMTHRAGDYGNCTKVFYRWADGWLSGSTGKAQYKSLDLEPRTLSGAPSTEFWTQPKEGA